METDITQETQVDPATIEDPEGNKEPEGTQAPSQEPAKVEKPEPEKKFTKRERLEHAKEKIESQLTELDDEEDDNRPVTVGDLKRRDALKSKETALELALEIQDEDERNQVVELLEDRITPSGDPQKDLALARGAVNSIRNQQMLEEQARKSNPNAHASTPGVPGKVGDQFVPTDEETVFMRAPYNLSKEDVIKARQREQQK
jgi:hypothetical protein